MCDLCVLRKVGVVSHLRPPISVRHASRRRIHTKIMVSSPSPLEYWSFACVTTISCDGHHHNPGFGGVMVFVMGCVSKEIRQLRLSVGRILRIELLRKLRRSVLREGSIMKLLVCSIIQPIATHRPEILLV
jgi:hypothetical protein